MKINILASGSNKNGYLIGDGQTELLIECGIRPTEMQRKLGFKTSRLLGVLVTHEHQDHSRAVLWLLKKGIDCYMTEGTAKALEVAGHHRIHIIKALKQFNLGAWIVLPFDTVHDAAEPVGFLIANGDEKLLFATDTAYIRYRFTGLTHLLLEKNYSPAILDENIKAGEVHPSMKSRLRKSHMRDSTTEDFLAVQDLSLIVYKRFIHKSFRNLEG